MALGWWPGWGIGGAEENSSNACGGVFEWNGGGVYGLETTMIPMITIALAVVIWAPFRVITCKWIADAWPLLAAQSKHSLGDVGGLDLQHTQ